MNKKIIHNRGSIEVSVYVDDTYIGWSGSKDAYHYTTLGSIHNDAPQYSQRLGELIAKAKELIDNLRVREELAAKRLDEAVAMASQVIGEKSAGAVEPAKPTYVPVKRRGFFSALRDSRRRR
jgi:hypothetical protein